MTKVHICSKYGTIINHLQYFYNLCQLYAESVQFMGTPPEALRLNKPTNISPSKCHVHLPINIVCYVLHTLNPHKNCIKLFKRVLYITTRLMCINKSSFIRKQACHYHFGVLEIVQWWKFFRQSRIILYSWNHWDLSLDDSNYCVSKAGVGKFI